MMCPACGKTACVYCNEESHECIVAKAHKPALSVALMDEDLTREVLANMQSLLREWNLEDPPQVRLSTRKELCTSQEIETAFIGASVRQDPIQPAMLVLDGDRLPNERVFQHLCTKGQPFLVSCRDSVDPAFWDPDALSKHFVGLNGKIRNAVTGEVSHASMNRFFQKLKRGRNDVLKIADFPEDELDMETAIPQVLRTAQNAMPFKRHILPSGPLNLVSSITWGMNYPDVKAKFFSGDGTLNENTATALHTDLANAANMCFWASPSSEEDIAKTVDFLRPLFPDIDASKLRNSEFGALWYVFLTNDYDGVNNYLREKNSLDKSKDPIQQKKYLLTKDDLNELVHKHDIQPIVFVQRAGDVVVLPANLPHHVININSCIKMAFDFVSHTTAARALDHVINKIGVLSGKNREDYIGLPRMIYHATARAGKMLQGSTALRRRCTECEQQLDDCRKRLETVETQSDNYKRERDEAWLKIEDLQKRLDEYETPVVPKKTSPAIQRKRGRPVKPKKGRKRKLLPHEASSSAAEPSFVTEPAPMETVDITDDVPPTLSAVGPINLDSSGDIEPPSLDTILTEEPSTSQGAAPPLSDSVISVESDSFVSYTPLKRIRKKAKEKSFKCQYCQAIFASRLDLRKHMSEAHPENEDVLVCWHCTMVFPIDGNKQRMEHMREKHPYQFCQECGKT